MFKRLNKIDIVNNYVIIFAEIKGYIFIKPLKFNCFLIYDRRADNISLMKKRVSLKDIAKKVGVSITLVSYVLNNKHLHSRRMLKKAVQQGRSE